jgi:hypothetical protein
MGARPVGANTHTKIVYYTLTRPRPNRLSPPRLRRPTRRRYLGRFRHKMRKVRFLLLLVRAGIQEYAGGMDSGRS